MSTGIDKELVREHYQQMSNEHLIKIATEDAAGMTPEAQHIIKEEIVRRKLNESLIENVQFQNKIYTDEEIAHYYELARNLDCPVCGKSSSKLNGSLTSTVLSFIIFTMSSKTIKIACPACLDKANDSALSLTRIMGWWGIPSGIIKTVQAIELNKKSKKTNHLETANEHLKNFVLLKIKEFDVHQNDKQKLQQIILSE